MSEKNVRARFYLRAGVVAAVCLVIAGLIVHQFRRLGREPGPAQVRREKRKPISVNRPRGAHLKSVDVKPAAPLLPDLEGEREPTEAELIRYSILRYLAEIRAAAPGNLEKIKAFPRNKAELEELLRNLPPEAVPIVAELLRNESDFVCRRILIYGLADIGTDEAAAVLRDYFMEHIEDESMGSEMRHVVWALERCPAETAFEALRGFLEVEDSDAVRRLRPHYVEALGKHRLGYEAVPLFFDLLENDGSDLVRNKAAQAVKNVGKRDIEAVRDTLPVLQESYAVEGARQAVRLASGGDSIPYVQQTILGAIGRLGDPGAVPFLLEVGTTDSFPERLSAAAALARIGGPEAMDALKEVYANIDRKKKLVEAIGELSEPNAIPFLTEVVLSAESEAVKKTALIGIWRAGGEEAREAFRRIAEAEDQPEVVRKYAQERLKNLTGGG